VTSVPFFLAFFALVVVFAIARGGGPERTSAVAMITALAGSAWVGFLSLPGGFRVASLGLLVVDSLLLVALCAIAIRANRWWPIPVAGCQLVAVLVHAGKLLDSAMIPNGYAFLVTIWSWPMVLMLGLGTWAHRRRLSNRVIVPGWKPSSGPPRSPTRARSLPD
jgi:hypothetical protein